METLRSAVITPLQNFERYAQPSSEQRPYLVAEKNVQGAIHGIGVVCVLKPARRHLTAIATSWRMQSEGELGHIIAQGVAEAALTGKAELDAVFTSLDRPLKALKARTLAAKNSICFMIADWLARYLPSWFDNPNTKIKVRLAEVSSMREHLRTLKSTVAQNMASQDYDTLKSKLSMRMVRRDVAQDQKNIAVLSQKLIAYMQGADRADLSDAKVVNKKMHELCDEAFKGDKRKKASVLPKLAELFKELKDADAITVNTALARLGVREKSNEDDYNRHDAECRALRQQVVASLIRPLVPNMCRDIVLYQPKPSQ